MRQIIWSTYPACTEADPERPARTFRADVVIANPPTASHICCAEALQVRSEAKPARRPAPAARASAHLPMLQCARAHHAHAAVMSVRCNVSIDRCSVTRH
jgi:hypothetical protein